MEPTGEITLLSENCLPQGTDLAEMRQRFSSAPWLVAVPEVPVTLIGCGGIGSWTALLLARLGANLTIIDNDTFEMHNMSGQLVSPAEEGQYKVTAIQRLCQVFANKGVSVITERVERLESIPRVLITGLDNMSSRKSIFSDWLKIITRLPQENRAGFLYIDGRLSADALQIYAFRGSDVESIKHYQETALFEQSEADRTVCSFKQTSHLACMIASKIVSDYTGFLMSLVGGEDCYLVPYFEQYDAVLFTNVLLKSAPKK